MSVRASALHASAHHGAPALFPAGERARLCLAQMLLSSATVLVCDEPTNHLDLEARAYLLEALRCFDGAILLTSHDRHFAAAAATRYVELHEGVLHDPRDGARDGARDGDDDEDGESKSDDEHASTHAAAAAAPFFPFAAKYGFMIDGGRGSGSTGSSRRQRARSSREPRPRLASSALGGVLGDGADATSGWEDLILQRDREEDATLAAAHAAAGGATVAGGARNSANAGVATVAGGARKSANAAIAAKAVKVAKVDKATAGRAPRKDVSSKAVSAAGEGGSAPKVRSGSGRSGDGGSSTSGSSTSRSGGGGGGKGGGGGGGGAKRAAGGADKGKALAPGTKAKGTPFWKGLKDAKAKRFED